MSEIEKIELDIKQRYCSLLQDNKLENKEYIRLYNPQKKEFWELIFKDGGNLSIDTNIEYIVHNHYRHAGDNTILNDSSLSRIDLNTFIELDSSDELTSGVLLCDKILNECEITTYYRSKKLSKEYITFVQDAIKTDREKIKTQFGITDDDKKYNRKVEARNNAKQHLLDTREKTFLSIIKDANNETGEFVDIQKRYFRCEQPKSILVKK